MRAAAEFVAVVGDLHRAHGLAVLLVEERIGAGFDGLGHAHLRRGDSSILADDAPHLMFDGMALLGREAAIEGVVEAQVVGRDQRSCLAGRVPEGVAQGAMEHVRAGVVAHRPRATIAVDLGQQLLTDAEASVQLAVMDDEPGHGALRVLDREEDLVGSIAEDSAITDLAATLGIERRFVEHDLGVGGGLGVALGVGARLQLVVLGGAADDGLDPAHRGRLLVAMERRIAGTTGDAVEERGLLGLAGEVQLLARAAALPLLLKGGIEAVPVDAYAVLGRQLDGEVDGEAIGVVKPEGGLAVEHRGILGNVLGTATHDTVGAGERDECFLELDGARVERPGEGRLLADDGAEDDVTTLAQDGIGVTHQLDDDLGRLFEEGLMATQQPAVAHGTPDDAAQHVAASLVRRHHAIGDEEGDGPRVVGDDLVAEALALEGIGVMLEQLAHARVDGHEHVGVVVGGRVLQHRGEAFEAHAGVDRLEGQLCPWPLDRLVELHEYEIPDLQPARAGLGVVGHAAGPLGILLPAVEVDLAVGSAGTRVGHAPEVVVVAVVDIAPSRHALRRQADLIAPDGPRFLVVGIGGGSEAVTGDAQVLGQELPGPVDSLALEVITEGPAAEHLEQGVVAGRTADLFEVVVLAGHAQAALRVDGARIGALLDAAEDVLELDHAAVGEQQRLVATGHEAAAGHDLMAAFGEEAEEAIADLVRGQGLHPGLRGGPVLVVRHVSASVANVDPLASRGRFQVKLS